MKKNKVLLYKIFLILFGILYLFTAFISFLHAVEFFQIGNTEWMSYVLSGVFEIGQMSVLMSLLISDNKKKLLPWFLMLIFTSVQVISNVYSVTKYIMLSEVEYYKYLEHALKFVTQNVPQDMIVTLIAWIIGGLLPICALLLTAMCASQISIMEGEFDEDQADNKYETGSGIVSDLKNDEETVHNIQQPIEEKREVSHKKESSKTPPLEGKDVAITNVDVNKDDLSRQMEEEMKRKEKADKGYFESPEKEK